MRLNHQEMACYMFKIIKVVERYSVYGLALYLISACAHASEGFDVIALGVWGGIKDGDLSAYMIQPHGDSNSVACDAGTLVNGIGAAIEKGSFDNQKVPEDSSHSLEGYILTEQIKGYLISHAHMDHIAGLVIASPDDTAKPIYGFAPVLKTIQDSYFNWSAWPNFGNQGKDPLLGKYQYTAITPSERTAIKNTTMSVTAFPLSHDGKLSSAFLIESGEDFLMCFGDTGPDQVEQTGDLERVWLAVANKMKTAALKGIIIESSFANSRDDKHLYGHLTPKYLMQELSVLAEKAGSKKALNGLPVIVNHIKYTLKQKSDIREKISAELASINTLGVRFIIPKQGERWHLN